VLFTDFVLIVERIEENFLKEDFKKYMLILAFVFITSIVAFVL